MDFNIVKIGEKNYSLFDEMLYWRMNGKERVPSKDKTSQSICNELSNPNLYIYAVEVENKYVGWISLVYIPKVDKFNGHGHIYVDELWVAPSYRKNGYAYELMKVADVVRQEKYAAGIRLYVNIENEAARKLYEKCDYIISGTAYFMEK